MTGMRDCPSGRRVGRVEDKLATYSSVLAAVGGNVFLGDPVDDRANSRPNAGARLRTNPETRSLRLNGGPNRDLKGSPRGQPPTLYEQESTTPEQSHGDANTQHRQQHAEHQKS